MKEFAKTCVRVAVACGVLLQLAKAQSQEILIDFGSSSMQSTVTGTQLKTWNNVHELNVNSPNRNLLTSSGASTGISLRVTGLGGVNPNGSTNPSSATLGSLANPAATRDSFFVGSGATMSLLLGNMPTTGVFKISFFGSRDIAETRHTRYALSALEASTTTLQTSGSLIGASPEVNTNRSNIAVRELVRPRADGTIQIDISASFGAWAYINALSIEPVNEIAYLPPQGEVYLFGVPRVSATLSAKHYVLGAPATASYLWESVASPGQSPTVIQDSSTGGSSYAISQADEGKWIRCRITPSLSAQQAGFISAVSEWLGPIRSSTHLSVFHVGNSLTRLANIPAQLENLSRSANFPLLTSLQATDGKNLRYHWDNGAMNGADLSAGTRSREQLAAGGWEHLVLQPHSEEWQTSASRAEFTEYARRFYQMADSRGAQVYFVLNWPWQTMPLSTQEQINSSFETVRQSVSTGGQKQVLIIPAGQALRAVVEACGSGALWNYNRSSFYIDNVHQTALGGYVTALTHFATIHKRSPVGLPASTLSSWGENQSITLPGAVATRIQEIVWGVVSSYPNSGVTSASPPPPPPLTPNVLPPPVVVDPDPTFVTESNLPPDPVLLAHAFGPGEPGSPALQANLPRALAPLANGRFAVEYRVNPAAEASGVVYTPHWSYDLRRWTATQPSDTLIERTENTVKVSWPLSSRWRFLRIHVAPPPQ